MADQTPCTASEASTDDAERAEAITPAAFYAAAAASALGFGGGRRTVATAVAANKLVCSKDYYSPLTGHLLPHLHLVHEALRPGRGGRRRPAVWLAGDSSFDNKAWVPHDWSAARNGYENALAGPMQEDVCFHVNAELQAQGHGGPEGHFCVNAAVEMSLLYARGCGLYAQDEFLRDHLEEQDTLLVSVGGNDIALQPLLATLANVGALALTPEAAPAGERTRRADSVLRLTCAVGLNRRASGPSAPAPARWTAPSTPTTRRAGRPPACGRAWRGGRLGSATSSTSSATRWRGTCGGWSARRGRARFSSA